MKEPLVSVIMPAYRCAATIRGAIQSVMDQDVPLELIVIDDCSPESLDEALQPYREDPRVTVVRNEQNMGAAESRNRGVAMARGRYVAFLDADDIWKPGKLQKQLKKLDQTGAVLCCTGRELLTPEGKSTGRVIPVKEVLTYRELLKHNAVNCSSVVLLTEVAREFPMHHADSHEDYILWLEILRKYGFCCAVNEPLLCYRLSTTGKSGNKLHSAKMTFRVYRYVGFSYPQSVALFVSYAFQGVKKYALSMLGGKNET